MLERLAAGKISDEERGKQLERIAAFSWRKSAEKLLHFFAAPKNQQ